MFNNIILNNINIFVKQSDFFALLGFNGAGKTTMINILNSLIKKELSFNIKFNIKSNEFSKEFNIIIGDKIGIQHIISLLFYTDFSKLCFEFRKSFRSLNNNETINDIQKRHAKYYYLSRYLFEAIQFYGNKMNYKLNNNILNKYKKDNNLKLVYTGLNKLLLFNQFTSYLNQPISTTTDIDIAKKFATNNGNNGIILYLQDGHINNTNNNNILLSYNDEIKNKCSFFNVFFLPTILIFIILNIIDEP